MVGLEQNAEKLGSFAQLITELASRNYADILNFTRFWPPRVPKNYKGGILGVPGAKIPGERRGGAIESAK